MNSPLVVNSAWMAAASLGIMGALKDQGGLQRLSSSLRSLSRHIGANIRSVSQSTIVHSSSIVAVSQRLASREEKLKLWEESLGKVMFLNSWGPN
ncbi:hypothetical protein ACHQM5_003489 [Ranunculus cassubicifolius]